MEQRINNQTMNESNRQNLKQLKKKNLFRVEIKQILLKTYPENKKIINSASVLS